MIRKYRLPLQTKGYVETIRLPQYDQSYMLVFDMHGLPEGTTDLEDYTAKMEGTRSDGLKYEYTGTISGTSVSFEIDTRMTAAAGNGEARIVFSYASTGEIYASANFQTYIDASPVPDDAADADTEEAREIADEIREIVSTAAAQTTAEAERIVADLEADVDDVKEDLNAVFVVDSASGSVAHFVDGAENVPMKSVNVALEPIQSGSGDPSPDNVRPITGWDAVKIYHSGADTEDATEYEISLSSAGTVYGGTLDVVSGELTVDRRFFNAKDKNWSWGGGTYAYTAVADTDTTQKTEVVSSTFKYYGGAGTVDGCVSWGGSPNNGNLIVRSAQVAPSLSDWNSYIASNDVTFVYYLAEPQTIQLTATEIKSLLCINNVWSDAGDMDVEYRADTKLYIDKRLGV